MNVIREAETEPELPGLVPVSEATSLTRTKYQALRDSNRTSRSDFRPRIYATTNPGGVGHAWFKKTFITPALSGRETDSRFIFGTVDDNRFVDKDYKKKLEENTGWRLRAYRYGDWDIAAGQFFTTFRRDVHAVSHIPTGTIDGSIPGWWPVWLAMDYGFTHWNVVYLFAAGPDGTIYTVDEHAEQQWLPERHAAAVTAMLARHGLGPGAVEVFVTGADVFARRPHQEGSIAEMWARHGWTLTPADQNRISGAAEMLRRLGDLDAGLPPSWYIHERCARLLECIPALEHDPHRPEDVLKWDTDEDGLGGDDPYDAARYGLMVRAGAGAVLEAGANPLAQWRG